jgi:hypothetical protein
MPKFTIEIKRKKRICASPGKMRQKRASVTAQKKEIT